MILAVDPGKRAGWAFYIDYVIRHGVVDGDSVEQVEAVLKECLPINGVLVLEDQFIGKIKTKKGPRHPKQESTKTLLRRRHIWELLALSRNRGNRIETVNPRTWQAYYKLKPGDKEGICKVAKALTGIPTEPDESDAILIAHWYAAQERSRRVVEGR